MIDPTAIDPSSALEVPMGPRLSDRNGNRHATQRKALWVLVAGVCIFTSQLSSAAEFKVGNWEGSALNGDNHQFTHCVMNASYKSGMSLLFAITDNWVFNVGVADARWKLDQGKSYDVVFRVDNRFEKHLSATAVSDKLALVSFVDPDAVPAFNALRHGRLLTITANETQFPFYLSDTSVALMSLIECVKTHQVNQPNARTVENPFTGSEKPTPSPSPPQTTTLDRAGVRRLLDDAGLSSAVIVDDSERQKQLPGWSFVWKGEDYMGGIQVVNAQGKNLNDVTTDLMAGDSKTCSDKFASGALDRPRGTSDRVRSVFTSCKGPVVDLYVLYAVSPNDNGTFTVVGTMGRSSSLDKIEEADKAVATVLVKEPGGHAGETRGGGSPSHSN
jgi:hypothetical protein